MSFNDKLNRFQDKLSRIRARQLEIMAKSPVPQKGVFHGLLVVFCAILRFVWSLIRCLPAIVRGMRRQRSLQKLDEARERERIDRIKNPERWRGK